MKVFHKKKGLGLGSRDGLSSIKVAITQSWERVAPAWPLKSLVAANPLQGYEKMPIESALEVAYSHYEQCDPSGMRPVNKETIKWLQAFCGQEQPSISIPHRGEGFYECWHSLVQHDGRVHQGDKARRLWLSQLPRRPELAIAECMLKLGISRAHYTDFLTLMLTTLPGWAAHLKYESVWSGWGGRRWGGNLQAGYLAMRLVLTCLLYPAAGDLLIQREKQQHSRAETSARMVSLEHAETAYLSSLLSSLGDLGPQPRQLRAPAAAQWVFCIDVRSEPMRRALEYLGDYETLGFAGFFALAARVENELTKDGHDACPALLSPSCVVPKVIGAEEQGSRARFIRWWHEVCVTCKQVHHSIKYTFTSPFVLAELMGPLCGLWMLLKNFLPWLPVKLAERISQTRKIQAFLKPDLSFIELEERCAIAKTVLTVMGLTSRFAPLVVFCGHRSDSQNNPHATALDCGACGGNPGGDNARSLAAILNMPLVRQRLAQDGIFIPDATRFVGAEHNTTTGEMVLFPECDIDSGELAQLENDLKQAQGMYCAGVSELNGLAFHKAKGAAIRRSHDWSETRPEWGLARNAALIIAKRELTNGIDLEGRCFLHSYDWVQDGDGSALEAIFAGPVVVAQWINAQYLFSSLNNVAYGAGDKATVNVVGKVGVMQGNASDLMHGLPLQSVALSEDELYHEPMRLRVVVHAPRERVDDVLGRQEAVRGLFDNGWLLLICIDPGDGEVFEYERGGGWTH